MKRITKIITDDGSEFNTKEEATKYIEVKYGNLLTNIAHNILLHDKYIPLCEFLDNNLNLFNELIELKSELNGNIEDEEDEEDEED